MSKIMYKGISYANAGVSSDATSIPTADMTAAFDSTAHMNSTDMTSQEVSDFVDGLDAQGANVADYVVEQGTSGSWDYRKWNSGFSEAWSTLTFASGSFTATGNIYYRNLSYTIPSGFFIEKPFGIVTVSFGAVGAAELSIGSATQFGVTMLSARADAQSGICYVYFKGRWK